MDREEFLKRLMGTFLSELEEHVRSINRDALAIERGEGEVAELVKTLFRATHSLKGAARSVGIAPIESACHHLESLLGAARDHGRVLGPGETQLLLGAADAIEDAGARLRRREPLDGAPLVAMLPTLEAAARGTVALHTRAPAPPPAPRAAARAAAPAPTPAAAAKSATASVPPPPPPGDGAAGDGAAADGETEGAASAPSSEKLTATPRVPAQGTATGHDAASDTLVRVSADKLDALLLQSGELLVTRNRIGACWQGLEEVRDALADKRLDLERATVGQVESAAATAMSTALRSVEAQLERLDEIVGRETAAFAHAVHELDETVRRIRMVPFIEACHPLDRAVRDVARTSGKAVALELVGGDVELDRQVVERIRDPLLHLVRNAVDHGVEAPDERVRVGKPAQAVVRVSARIHGHDVEISVADDGRGLDRGAIAAKASARGLAVPSDVGALERMVFAPGFSTAATLTSVSGRGVGLDVVKAVATQLHGSVDFTSKPGRGAQCTLVLPLDLATMRVLLVEVSGRTFALATGSVQRVLRVELDALATVGGQRVLRVGDTPLPVFSLADLLGVPARPQAERHAPAVVLASARTEAVVLVDALLSNQEVVLKGLGRRLLRVRNVLGVTRLGGGQTVLVLNAPELLQSALRDATTAAPTAASVVASPKRLLVVDDSVTTRTLVKTILEAAGYEVTAAADGAQAWQLLQTITVDAVISDVEMPRMDGIGLTETIRRSASHRELPVVLVTSLGSDRDRARGVQAGASAYLTKSGFDQQTLLDTVATLL